jgi:glycosyltransferase involved in cell wall biosynthesis
MNKVSIIIPVYNAAPYLQKCIETVLHQTYSNIEVILINDGSKDNSLEICKEYAAVDNRIKVFDIPNGGVSNARNMGIENATGDYLMFVDADDWLSEDAIEKCCPYMSDYDIIRFSALAVYPHRTRKYKLCKSSSLKKIMGRIISRATIVACWGGLFSRKLFADPAIRFDTSLVLGEDWLMTARLTQRCRTIKMLPDLYGYFYNKTNENSCTLTLAPSKILTQFKAWKKIRECVPSGYNAEFGLTRCLFIQELIDNCGMTEARKLLHEAKEDFRCCDLIYTLSANISIRKKISLLKFYIKFHE